MKRLQLIQLARKLGVSEQYYTSPTKRLIWAIQEAEGKGVSILDENTEFRSDRHKWSGKK